MPAETLTFLFTDIEGSTPLWDTRAEAMRAATERHNALLREAIGARGGNAFRVVGDAFCVAFADATAAVLAAIEGQRALCAQAWGEAPIHVRMGLHSGVADPAEDEVFRGPALARAARVMAAAHGDQILATAATVALLDRTLPTEGTLRDLGDHTLRGFARPERLYQVLVPGLRAEFPPIRTQEAQHTNLPPSLTTFVGRAQALADVRDAARKSRMVSLIGPGGTGKTRLAIESARELVDAFPDGVWLVELAPVADAGLVSHAIAGTLGARAEGDVKPMALIESTLQGKRALLLLDNCEHVVDEVAQIAQALLRSLPQLHLLASSREALGVAGEAVYRVPSLTMPREEGVGATAEVAASEAGALFLDRARAVAPGFGLTEKNAPAVARVCRRLDGIPLAIELAAARLTSLSVEELARRVDDRFRLLTGGARTAMPRQRTLRALVDWSYELLSEEERRVLDTLAVFAGSFSLAAAESVCAGNEASATTVLDAIDRLVAKSLLIVERQHETETRYRLLETIRQYAGEKLAESGEADAARRRHCSFFLVLAQRANDEMRGPRALEWLDRLETEHDNLRAALDWSADAAPGDHARLAAAMATFWDTRGYFTEGWARLERALAAPEARDAARLGALCGAGVLAYRLDHTQRSDEILSEAIALAQELGDTRSEIDATLSLAVDRQWRGPEAVEPLAIRAENLAKAAGAASRQGVAVLLRGRAAMDRGQFTRAQDLLAESARLLEGAGCVLRAPLVLQHAGECAVENLDFPAARRLLDEALIKHRRMGNVHDAATTLRWLANLALNERRLDDADARVEESLRMFRSLHDPNCTAATAATRAAVLRAMGDAPAALDHAEAAVANFRERAFFRALVGALWTLSGIHGALGDVATMRRTLLEALEAQRRADNDRWLPRLLEAAAGSSPQAAAAPALLGSAAALRERHALPVFPAEREDYERSFAAVRAAYATGFELAFAAGCALGRNEAIARAAAVLQAAG